MWECRKLLILALISARSSWTHAYYARNLTLNFLCTPLETKTYVRDVPWDCASYVICLSGLAIPVACPQGKLYAAAERNLGCEPAHGVNASRCVGVIWDYIHEICRHNPTSTIPDAAMCGQYYNCTVRDSRHEFVEYLLECPYPSLFSTLTGACKDYRFVTCGERTEQLAPCDYHQYLQLHNCAQSNCPACNIHHPSCVGLQDGNHQVASSADTVIICQDQRTMYVVPKPEQTTLIPTTAVRVATVSYKSIANTT